MKGSYILQINLSENKNIKIGSLGNIFFKKGNYYYVGSALNGLEQRINRHLRSDKKMHWHIDYLLQHGDISNVFYKENNEKEECKIVKQFEKNLSSIPSFGCSDCKCNSHLFYSSQDEIKDILESCKKS